MPSPSAMAHSPTETRGLRWLARALAGVTVLLALALASDRFQATLNSDYLLAHVFSHEITDFAHPLSGWKFGSAAFWFPDYALYLPLYALCGNSGWSYPLYAVALFLLLGATMSWSLAAAGVNRGKAPVAGFLALNIILLCQWIPGHADELWLIAIPAFHGGDLVMGFALMALVLGAAHKKSWSLNRSLAAVAVMALGLASSALLLFHWMIPLALALGWQARRTPALRTVLAGFFRRAALAIALALASRAALEVTQTFFFGPLFREQPLPTRVWQTLAQFFSDITSGGLFANQWMFWALAAVAIVVTVSVWRPRPEKSANPVTRIALGAGLLGLLIALIMPILSGYWHDPTSFRYLLNWLIVPVWLLALWVCVGEKRLRWLSRVVIIVAMLGLALASSRIAEEKLVFPNPPETQALRDFCAQRGLREGLADYWHNHYLSVLWDFSGPRLSQIRDKDFTYFWCNNAFEYFPPADDGHGLRQPAPQFVILDGLDRALLAQRLGGTLKVEQVGPYAVALLSAEQTRRAGELITAQVEQFLQGRRLDWLKTQLPAVPPEGG